MTNSDCVKIKAKSEVVVKCSSHAKSASLVYKKLVKGLDPESRRTSLKMFAVFLNVPPCKESC